MSVGASGTYRRVGGADIRRFAADDLAAPGHTTIGTGTLHDLRGSPDSRNIARSRLRELRCISTTRQPRCRDALKTVRTAFDYSN